MGFWIVHRDEWQMGNRLQADDSKSASSNGEKEPDCQRTPMPRRNNPSAA